MVKGVQVDSFGSSNGNIQKFVYGCDNLLPFSGEAWSLLSFTALQGIFKKCVLQATKWKFVLKVASNLEVAVVAIDTTLFLITPKEITVDCLLRGIRFYDLQKSRAGGPLW